MASDEKEHRKRLKEADKIYKKQTKLFRAGKISKEELKDKLRPYKFELKELGYPVKIKEGEEKKATPSPDTEEKTRPVKEEGEKALEKKPKALKFRSWKKRSPLTVEEIEARIDLISIGKGTSESLKRKYQNMYGEDLVPPEDLVPFTHAGDLQAKEDVGSLPSADEDNAEEQTSRPDEPEEASEEGEKKPFWKSIFGGSKDKGSE